jgi:hypothetical protein
MSNQITVEDAFKTSFENLLRVSGVFEYSKEICFVSPLFEYISLGRERCVDLVKVFSNLESFCNPGLLYYSALNA